MLRDDRAWQIRLGIHTGPIVAGIIGTRKFAFDVWGDTVNTSSRLQTGSRTRPLEAAGHGRDAESPGLATAEIVEFRQTLQRD